MEARGLFGTKEAPAVTYCTVKTELPGKEKLSKVEKKLRKRFETLRAPAHRNPVFNEAFSFALDSTEWTVRIKVKRVSTFKDKDLGSVSVRVADFKEKKFQQGWFELSSPERACAGFVYLKLVMDEDLSDYEKKTPARFDVHRRSKIHFKTHHLDLKEPDAQELKVLVGTWNVGNRPPGDDLSEWLPKQGFDLVAVGAQECQYKERKPHGSCEADWENVLTTHVGQDYVVVEKKVLLQMRLYVFASKRCARLITQVDQSREATGVASVVGNKGGVVVSLNVRDTSICFVNSHLAAHQNKKQKRNDDVAEIVEGLRVGVPGMDILNQFDHVVWMGDLNYRLDYGNQGDDKSPSEKQFNEMVELVNQKRFRELYAADQLLAEMKAGHVFRGFEEGPLDFPPTFKLERKEGFVYDSERSPAWCDRVVWRSLPGAGPALVETSLKPAGSVWSSDHKPVAATFNMPVISLPVGTTDLLGPCSVIIRKLRASNLPKADVTGAADPYVVFCGDILRDEKPRTATKMNTLEPKWEDNDVPPLPLQVNARNRLRHSRLLIQVWDYDATSGDDFMCCGFLPLRPYVAGVDDEKVEEVESEFRVELTRGGLPKGVLEGTIMLKWEPTKFRPELIQRDAAPAPARK
jgi:endonuclease/exonuclease/phosphatase family metal-dependent hydrolase